MIPLGRPTLATALARPRSAKGERTVTAWLGDDALKERPEMGRETLNRAALNTDPCSCSGLRPEKVSSAIGLKHDAIASCFGADGSAVVHLVGLKRSLVSIRVVIMGTLAHQVRPRHRR